MTSIQNANQDLKTTDLPIEILNFLDELSIKLQLSAEHQNILINEFDNFAKNISKAFDTEDSNSSDPVLDDFNNIDGIKQKISQTWGENLDVNKVFLQRALQWMDIKSLEDLDKIDMFKFLNKMVDLGKLLSEDNNLFVKDVLKDLSKEEAVSLRKQLMNDREFYKMISDKNHSNHKQAQQKLHKLNEIISQN